VESIGRESFGDSDEEHGEEGGYSGISREGEGEGRGGQDVHENGCFCMKNIFKLYMGVSMVDGSMEVECENVLKATILLTKG